MELNDRKELFSYAYIRAVAAAAGFVVEPRTLDRDAVDLEIIADSKFHPGAPHLEVQVKCTADFTLEDDHFTFPLRVENYERLRKQNLAIPRILIVMLVPANCIEWLDISEERMLSKRCAYFRSLYGQPATDNAATISVQIPRANVFDVAALGQMMSIAGGGEFP